MQIRCKHCGIKTTAKVFWKKYCSHNCRQKAFALREANKAMPKPIKKEVRLPK